MASKETARYHSDVQKRFSLCVYAASYDSILMRLKENQNGLLSFKLILTTQNLKVLYRR